MLAGRERCADGCALFIFIIFIIFIIVIIVIMLFLEPPVDVALFPEQK